MQSFHRLVLVRTCRTQTILMFVQLGFLTSSVLTGQSWCWLYLPVCVLRGWKGVVLVIWFVLSELFLDWCALIELLASFVFGTCLCLLVQLFCTVLLLLFLTLLVFLLLYLIGFELSSSPGHPVEMFIWTCLCWQVRGGLDIVPLV